MISPTACRSGVFFPVFLYRELSGASAPNGNIGGTNPKQVGLGGFGQGKALGEVVFGDFAVAIGIFVNQVTSVEFDHEARDDHFDVDVRTADGREYDVKIDARSGKVRYVKRDD